MSMKLNCHDNVIVLEKKNDQLILFKKFFFLRIKNLINNISYFTD